MRQLALFTTPFQRQARKQKQQQTTMTTNTYEEQLHQLIVMGYEPEMAKNALEAAGGDVEMAVEILQADESQRASNETQRTSNISPTPRTGTIPTAPPAPPRPGPHGASMGGMPNFQGNTAKEVVKHWQSQLSPEVRASAKSAGKTAKSAWSTAVTKIKQVDDKYQLSAGAKDAIKQCDTKMKSFDEKHEWSKKTNKAASQAGAAIKSIDEKHEVSKRTNKAAVQAGAAFSRTVDSAKKSYAEQRQDEEPKILS